MSEGRGKKPGKSFPQKWRSGSHAPSCVSSESDQSLAGVQDFSVKRPSATERLQYETLDSHFLTQWKDKIFTDNLPRIFQDLESKVITFFKNEVRKFMKILQKEYTQYYVKDFNENRCSISEAALDLTLYFLREMKQDEAADTLEDELLFVHQVKGSLKKKYQCVFEGIAKQGEPTLLNNIYTDIYITQDCSEQMNTEHEVRKIEVASRHRESRERQVECKNVFEASKPYMQIRTVLTKGVAGIGKSVYVQKFVLDWAEGKENQDISFIFPLSFREMNFKMKEKQSLMDLICQFFPETKGLNLTRRNQFKVLFILDGLDECCLPLNFKGETWSDVSSPASLDVLLTNLIKGNLLDSALIWITTRPAAASKIPAECIDHLTEIRGFSDAQKVEYFKKRFTDEDQSTAIINHVKKCKSLFIMCHIPVFCWISATVLQNILEEKRNNDQVADTSKTLQESNTEDTSKTLTQMYTHFLCFQIQQSRRKYDGEYRPDVSWDKNVILSLGKLAFHQLERNNLIFYDTDLEACGIDVYKASVYSGMCTQIFKEEAGTMYCFVDISIQEFIAALYAHMFLDISNESVFVQDFTKQKNKNETMIDLLKTAVDKALESYNGHLDLFLRFLLGLSLQSNRRLLRGLLTQQDDNDQSKKEIVQYIYEKFEANLSPERSINLLYCLNELNDQTLVKEIQTHFSKGRLSSGDLSPAQWSVLTVVLLRSQEKEFELQKFKTSKRALERSELGAFSSELAESDDSNEGDRPNLSEKTPKSKRSKSAGSDDSNEGDRPNFSEETPSQTRRFLDPWILCENLLLLSELNLSGHELGDTRVNQIAVLLQDKHCQLNTLILFACRITEKQCLILTSALKSNPSHLRELNLSRNGLGDSGVKQLSYLLMNPQCKLEKLDLFACSITEKQCRILTSALKLNPSHLRELNLSRNGLGDSGVKNLSYLLMKPQCKLEKLDLCACSITEKQCLILTSALKLNPSYLRELYLSMNKLGDSGVKHLSDLLMNTQCKLEKLHLNDCGITDVSSLTQSLTNTKALQFLKELDLRHNMIGNSKQQLIDVLRDSNCKLSSASTLCIPVQDS